jgi:hypothetical protein
MKKQILLQLIAFPPPQELNQAKTFFLPGEEKLSLKSQKEKIVIVLKPLR